MNMLPRSKASVALERLKEFDRKYKLKRDKRSESESESGYSVFENRVSSTGPLLHSSESKKTMPVSLKSKLDIPMPDTQVVDDPSSYKERLLGNNSTGLDLSASPDHQLHLLKNPHSAREAQTERNSSQSSSYKNCRIQAKTKKNPSLIDKESEQSEMSIDVDEDISSLSGLSKSITASSSTEKIARSYRSDTFEDASSSSILSRSRSRSRSRSPSHLQVDEQTKSCQRSDDSPKEKQVIELVSPKLVQSVSECEIGLDEDLSDYVKIIETVDQDSTEIAPLTLLKISVKRPETAFSENRPRYSKQRKAASNSIEQLLSNRNDKLIETQQIDPPNQEKRDDSQNGCRNNVTLIENESFMDPKVNRSSGATGKSEKSSSRSSSRSSSSSRTEAEDDAQVQAERSIIELLEENPEDEPSATQVLRKLNREAINAIVKRHMISKKKDLSEKTSSAEEEGSTTSSRRYSSKKGQRYSKNCNDARRWTNSRVRDEKLKVERLDSKESPGPRRRRLMALKLQQERRDLGNFLQELDKIHFLNGCYPIPKAPLVRPLELPNIESYERSESTGESPLLRPTTDIERLGEKLCEIQLWLKDQYTLYREYSKLVQIMNARHVPSNLQDAKETIRQLKTRANKITTQVK